MARVLLLTTVLSFSCCARQPAPSAPPSPTVPAAVAATPVDDQRGPFGSLSLTCEPGCRLWLDGEDTGFDAPVRGMPVRAGPHALRVVSPGGRAESLSIFVAPGSRYERAFQLAR
ncbi:MAG: hypothetical protein RL653_457 [Pseudomonadota bacterium]|jgi:hypothetical protein